MLTLLKQITVAARSLARPTPFPYRWIERITAREFAARLDAQRLPVEQLNFKCPRCACLYNANDLIAAGAGDNLQEVGKYLGVSCITRFAGLERSRSNLGQPCTWKLGGVLPFHKLEVIHQGQAFALFDVATAQEALAHLADARPAVATVPQSPMSYRDASFLAFSHLL